MLHIVTLSFWRDSEAKIGVHRHLRFHRGWQPCRPSSNYHTIWWPTRKRSFHLSFCWYVPIGQGFLNWYHSACERSPTRDPTRDKAQRPNELEVCNSSSVEADAHLYKCCQPCCALQRPERDIPPRTLAAMWPPEDSESRSYFAKSQ